MNEDREVGASPEPVSMLLPSGRTVSAARARSQAAMEEVRRLTNMLGNELRDLEIYARERASEREASGEFSTAPPARLAYRDMADRIKAIRGEA